MIQTFFKNNLLNHAFWENFRNSTFSLIYKGEVPIMNITPRKSTPAIELETSFQSFLRTRERRIFLRSSNFWSREFQLTVFSQEKITFVLLHTWASAINISKLNMVHVVSFKNITLFPI